METKCWCGRTGRPWIASLLLPAVPSHYLRLLNQDRPRASDFGQEGFSSLGSINPMPSKRNILYPSDNFCYFLYLWSLMGWLPKLVWSAVTHGSLVWSKRNKCQTMSGYPIHGNVWLSMVKSTTDHTKFFILFFSQAGRPSHFFLPCTRHSRGSSSRHISDPKKALLCIPPHTQAATTSPLLFCVAGATLATLASPPLQLGQEVI